MTQSTKLLLVILIATFAVSPLSVRPAAVAETKMQIQVQHELLKTELPKSTSAPAMNFPEMGLKVNGVRSHLARIDEPGRIHRFHKERVKKMRKHAGECWIAIKILLLCCHLALLVHAFMHLTH